MPQQHSWATAIGVAAAVAVFGAAAMLPTRLASADTLCGCYGRPIRHILTLRLRDNGRDFLIETDHLFDVSLLADVASGARWQMVRNAPEGLLDLVETETVTGLRKPALYVASDLQRYRFRTLDEGVVTLDFQRRAGGFRQGGRVHGLTDHCETIDPAMIQPLSSA